MRQWVGRLAWAALVCQLGCGSSSNKGSPSGNDAGENDATPGDDDSGVVSDGGHPGTGSEGGTSTIDGGDATVSTSTDAGPDSTMESESDGGHDGAGDALGADATSDGASDGASEAGAAWSPSSLSGLVLWLDGQQGLGVTDAGSDAGDGGPGLLWLDRSGQGNDAVGYGPTVGATALDGQPAVHFNGTDFLLVQDSTSLNWGTDDFVVAIVVQHTTFSEDAGPRYGTLYSKQAAPAPFTGVGLFANYPNGSSSILEQLNEFGSTEVVSGSTGYNDGVPFLVLIHRSSMVLPVDGGADGSADGGDAAAPPTTGTMAMLINAADAGFATGAGYAGDVSSTGYPLRIGGTQASQNMTGDIAEVIAIDGTVRPADLESLQSYLMGKYGL